MTAWTSSLSVADALALRQVGLTPVGHVFGVSVFHVGWSGTSYCGGYEAGRTMAEEWRGSRSAGEWSGFGAVVAALRKVRRRALEGVRANASALGADGVVGVRLELAASENDRNAVQFTAFGTAVRAESATHLNKPFLCSLTGVEANELLIGGWTPVDVALGVAVEIEHDDAESRTVLGVRGTFGPNAEVPSLTRLVTRARSEARRTLDGELERMGADGAVVSATTLDVRRSDCEVYPGLHDHVAQAVVLATGIAALSPHSAAGTGSGRRPAKRATRARATKPAAMQHRPPRPLSVLPLGALTPGTVAPAPAAPSIETWLD